MLNLKFNCQTYYQLKALADAEGIAVATLVVRIVKSYINNQK